MENKLFNLLCQLEAVHKLLKHDGDDLSLCYSNSDKAKKIQEEVNILAVKEVELYNAIRNELFAPKSENVKKEPKKIIKKEGKPKLPIFDKK